MLNETVLPAGSKPTVLIPHGHYIKTLPGSEVEPIPGRIVYFGRIEPYKNVDGLIEQYKKARRAMSLSVVGKASALMQESLMMKAKGNSSIVFKFGFVSDQEMVDEISQGEVVVLPYKEMHNSGVLLVALSLGKPALVPRTAANVALSEEVGQQWLTLFDDELQPSDIDRALQHAQNLHGSKPRLVRRDWDNIARSYFHVYKSILPEDADEIEEKND
ncbi:glycosyltransferase [Arthrobacter sp. RIT-PI-e]|uniref:glycosyltransferase n=1 Tax=Arthrobacter sp. RIT-PI-e TaxID=1681197 RepID=UPI001F1DDA92|nr:glycosyltransferase [Arthrobacter sp. RIT-PI-e]